MLKMGSSLLAVVLAGSLVSCTTSTKSADVSSQIRTSLDQAGFKDVSASQDRDQGVVPWAGTSQQTATRHKPNPSRGPSREPKLWQTRLQ